MLSRGIPSSGRRQWPPGSLIRYDAGDNELPLADDFVLIQDIIGGAVFAVFDIFCPVIGVLAVDAVGDYGLAGLFSQGRTLALS